MEQQRSEDHDILIRLQTVLELLYKDFQEWKIKTNGELAAKADKTELMDLARRMEAFQISEREDRQDYARELAGVKWWVGIGVGTAFAVSLITPIIFQFLKHSP